MSENSPPNPTRKPDARATRTRDRLGDALIELLQTKPFDDITVQAVLARARVSRSTFYAHYRDKDDLLLSDVDDFFQKMSTLLLTPPGDATRRVAPVKEFFAHVADAREFYAAMVHSGRIHDVRDLGEAHFARGIEERLARGRSGAALSRADRAAQAHALAGALFSLLFWWLRDGTKVEPAAMDERFHRLVPEELRLR